MRRFLVLMLSLALAASVLTQVVQADEKSDNIKRLAQVGVLVQEDDPKTEEDETVYAKGSDIAFEGDTMITGAWEGIGVFDILKKAPYVKQRSFAFCNGAQGDVSVWGDLAFMSVDTPQVRLDGSASNGECDSKNASQQEVLSGAAWEGVRIFNIKDRNRPPQLVGAVRADCGSHTHTLLPSGKKLYLYIHSYPLTSGLGPACNAVSHRKNFIFEVDLKNPAKTEKNFVGTLDVSPAVGCHDITVVPEKKIAVAACLTEGQVWDISDPTKPVVLSHIRNPFMLFHSSGLTWDGKIAVLGDEFAGAAAGAGCVSPTGRIGAMWFYDITDPENPKEVGHYGPPRTAFPTTAESAARHACTNHNFNILPMKNPKKYVAVTSYYAAGLSALDFSDPANPKEIAYYVPIYQGGQQSDMWAAYWYNGRIYTNDHLSGHGVGIFKMKGLGKKKVNYYAGGLNPQTQIARFK